MDQDGRAGLWPRRHMLARRGALTSAFLGFTAGFDFQVPLANAILPVKLDAAGLIGRHAPLMPHDPATGLPPTFGGEGLQWPSSAHRLGSPVESALGTARRSVLLPAPCPAHPEIIREGHLRPS
jgi:hypothetical protein